jgi:two-component sensor histidine kinase
MQQLRGLTERLQDEIADRKRIEQQLRCALQEKDVLLKEIHHRVKNNLQMISSLLYFQAQNTEDVRFLEVLQESRNRIKSIAIVHEQLYQAENLAKIEFDSYLRSLTSYLFHVWAVNTETIGLRITAEKIILTVETAIPCALVLNELVTNVLKHAFPNGRSGELRIDFHEDGAQVLLRVSDDGTGMPHDLDISQVESLGLSLVMDLVTKQLHGHVELDRTHGTQFTITFPIPHDA